MANSKTTPIALAAGAAAPPPEDFIQRRIWNFCTHPDDLNQGEIYVDPNTSYQNFPLVPVSAMSFYANTLPQPALTTEIELFAANLHIRLDTFDIIPKPGVTAPQARLAVRTILTDKTNTMQNLYDTVL